METLNFSLLYSPLPVLWWWHQAIFTCCAALLLSKSSITCVRLEKTERMHKGEKGEAEASPWQKPCHVAQSLLHIPLHFSGINFPNPSKLCWASQLNNKLMFTWIRTTLEWLQSQLNLNQKHADSHPLICLLSLACLCFLLPQMKFFIWSLHAFFQFSIPSLHVRKKNPEKCIILTSIPQQNLVVPGTPLSSLSPFCSVARWLINWKEES